MNQRSSTGAPEHRRTVGSRLTPISRRDLLHTAAATLTAAVLPPGRARAQPPGPVMSSLSAYMSAAAARALPSDAIEHAKQHVLDTMAAMISGAELVPGQAAHRLARAHGGTGNATVVGANLVAGPMDAALANGVMAHADETDDAHRPSRSHPGGGGCTGGPRGG